MLEARRALVVEDDPAWQDILDEILSDYGLQVDRAGNLDEAISQLREAAHLVAVVDLSLGYSDPHNQEGLLVLKALERHDPACVPVLLTGFATVELAVRAIREYGALACLRKENFQRNSLEEWIDQALIQAPVRSQNATLDRDISQPAADRRWKATRGEPSLLLDAILVEDDSGWRALVSELLEEEGFQAHKSNSYVEALGLLRRRSFNLAIVDLSLANSLSMGPNLDGYQLVEKFASEGTPTIVITGYAEPERIAKAYENFSLLACLEKQAFDRESFLQLIREVHRERSAALGIDQLTPREGEVLALLVEGKTNREISEALNVSENTVKRHLKSIFLKMGVKTRAAATARAFVAGMKPNL